MKAAIIEKRAKDGVVYKDCPPPQRKAGEALIKLEAASLNRVDLYMRDNGAGITHTLPQIMGVDGIGRIVEVDEDSPFQINQRVILYSYEFCAQCSYCLAGEQPLCKSAKLPGEHRDGTFAHYISYPTRSLLALSEEADAFQAASLGVAYLTAWRMIFSKAAPKAGQTALIIGAGGGVGCASVQLAKLAGCQVIATTSGEDKTAKIKQAGADIVIDYKKQDVVKEIQRITNREGVDFVIDNVGDATWGQSLRALKRGGKLITCGATTGAHPSADLQRLFIRQLSVHGSTLGNFSEFEDMMNSFERGQFKPIIDHVYPLREINLALERLETQERFGKVVINIAT